MARKQRKTKQLDDTGDDRGGDCPNDSEKPGKEAAEGGAELRSDTAQFQPKQPADYTPADIVNLARAYCAALRAQVFALARLGYFTAHDITEDELATVVNPEGSRKNQSQGIEVCFDAMPLVRANVLVKTDRVSVAGLRGGARWIQPFSPSGNLTHSIWALGFPRTSEGMVALDFLPYRITALDAGSESEYWVDCDPEVPTFHLPPGGSTPIRVHIPAEWGYLKADSFKKLSDLVSHISNALHISLRDCLRQSKGGGVYIGRSLQKVFMSSVNPPRRIHPEQSILKNIRQFEKDIATDFGDVADQGTNCHSTPGKEALRPEESSPPAKDIDTMLVQSVEDAATPCPSPERAGSTGISTRTSEGDGEDSSESGSVPSGSVREERERRFNDALARLLKKKKACYKELAVWLGMSDKKERDRLRNWLNRNVIASDTCEKGIHYFERESQTPRIFTDGSGEEHTSNAKYLFTAEGLALIEKYYVDRTDKFSSDKPS